MGDPPDSQATTALAAATGSNDPEIGLRAVSALRGLVEVLEALQVDNARAKGWSWQQIATLLGLTKQAVHQSTARTPRAGTCRGGRRHDQAHRAGPAGVPPDDAGV
jgi:hypothetical protein